MAGADRDAWRASVSDQLTALTDALSFRIGAEATRQVSEYIEHHEFGLALELIIALFIAHGVDGRPFEAGVARLAAAMGMERSEHLAAWRAHLDVA